MTDQKNLVAEGEVTENLPNTMFRVRVTNAPDGALVDKSVLCTIAGRMRLNYVRLLPGDKVRFEINQLDLTRGRIIYKLK
jgi:translation initiation factor IF-1